MSPPAHPREGAPQRLDAPAAALRTELMRSPWLRALVDRVLDRRDRTGRLPERFAFPARPGDAEAAALARAFPARSVDLEGAVLHLGRALGPGRSVAEVEAVLDRAAGRRRRDPRREEADRRRVASALVEERLGEAPAGSWVRLLLAGQAAALGADERPIGWTLAATHGLGAWSEHLGTIARCLRVLERTGSITLRELSRAATGSTKALVPGGAVMGDLCTALVACVPGLAERWSREAGEPANEARQSAGGQRALLALAGIADAAASSDVLFWGPLTYRAGGERFDGPARHARLGHPVKLTLDQVRALAVEPLPPGTVVTTIENETPFRDHVRACCTGAAGAAGAARSTGDAPAEIVVWSAGQPGRAVTELLVALAAAGAARVRHAGDLDLAGVQILDVLRRRTGLDVVPWRMEPDLLRAHREAALPLGAAAVRSIERALAERRLPCRTLLEELARAGAWLEQEVLFAPGAGGPA